MVHIFSRIHPILDVDLLILTHVSEVVWKFCEDLARGRTRDRARSTQPLQTTAETRVRELDPSLIICDVLTSGISCYI